MNQREAERLAAMQVRDMSDAELVEYISGPSSPLPTPAAQNAALAEMQRRLKEAIVTFNQRSSRQATVMIALTVAIAILTVAMVSANAERRGMMGLRSWLYWLAKILGDVNAVRRGRVGRRIARRAAGKVTGRGLRRLFR